MKQTSLFVLLLWATAASALLAQSPAPEKEPVPDPPLMAPAPADTQWTITYAHKTPIKEATTAEEIRLQKLRLRYSPQMIAKRVVKGDGQMVIYNTYEAGLKSESWAVGGLLFDLPIYEGEIIRSRSISEGDFTEISWVKPENFRGTVDLKGRKVHLYEVDIPTEGGGGGASSEKTGQAKAMSQRAYIDAKSRLPLVVDVGPTAWTYQYSAAPSAFPTPNPRIQKILQDGMKTKPANR